MRSLTEVLRRRAQVNGPSTLDRDQGDESMLNDATIKPIALEQCISEQLALLPGESGSRTGEVRSGVEEGVYSRKFTCQLISMNKSELGAWGELLPEELFGSAVTVSVFFDTSLRAEKQVSVGITSSTTTAELHAYIPLTENDYDQIFRSSYLSTRQGGGELVALRLTPELFSAFGQFFTALVAGQIK